MEKKFTVIDHDYTNTGGNTMVSIFTVYEHFDNVTRYVIVGDEGMSFQTTDTITNTELSLDNDELFKRVVLGSWRFDDLVMDDGPNRPRLTTDELSLFKYCEFEHYKKDCKHYGYKQRLMTNQLPTDLYWKLPLAYREWADAEGVGCLTDGYDVFMDPSYDPTNEKHDEELRDMRNARLREEAKEFSQWLKKFDCGSITFDSCFVVGMSGHCVVFPLTADSYELLDDFVDKAIKTI